MGAGKTKLYNVTEVDLNEYKCSDRGLLLPLISEYTWPIWARAILYFAFLLYLFLGIAKIADIFMTAIEQITSQKKKIKYINSNGDEQIFEKKIWNDTVANLTLMALGSSCPEILLAIIEIVGNRFLAGELGPGTIVGSAAYNLLIITALCVVAIPSPDVLRIEMFSVFLVTTFFSVFAYIWLYLVLAVITPDVVNLWEAILTLGFFVALIVLAYAAEKGFFLKKLEVPEIGNYKPKLEEDESKKLRMFIRHLEYHSLTSDEKQKLIQKYLQPNIPVNRLFYRIRATKSLTGSKGIHSMSNNLLEVYKEIMDDIESGNEGMEKKFQKLKDMDSSYSYIQFASPIYTISKKNRDLSNLKVTLIRTGNPETSIRLYINTKDATAHAPKDYDPIDYFAVTFEPYIKEKDINVGIKPMKDDGEKSFFISFAIQNPYGSSIQAKPGENENCLVILNGKDETPEIEFEKSKIDVSESDLEVAIIIIRKGHEGKATVQVETYDITATNRVDYEEINKEIVFNDFETEKVIKVPILNDSNKEDIESFGVRLKNPTGGVRIGGNDKVIVSIIDDDSVTSTYRSVLEKLHINPDYLAAQKLSWCDQFRNAANVNEGDSKHANLLDYIMHVISFPWKIMFAFVPPPGILGGWLCFIVSLIVIGALTALVGDAAAIFGCLVNLKDSITAISFVAMGTSLPDTFASFISAKNDKTADNAIGNVTGSNSVNVFLGLGLPWVLAAIYWQAQGLPFTVKAGDLAFSIVIFSIACAICLTVLFLRRFLECFGGGELGGPTITKWATTILFCFLWILYILLSSLKAYGIF